MTINFASINPWRHVVQVKNGGYRGELQVFRCEEKVGVFPQVPFSEGEPNCGEAEEDLDRPESLHLFAGQQ